MDLAGLGIVEVIRNRGFRVPVHSAGPAADRADHRCRLLGNRRLVAIVGQLRDQARMQGLQKLADQGELTRSGEEHIEIVGAIESGNTELAAELMREHLAHSRGIWAGRAENDT